MESDIGAQKGVNAALGLVKSRPTSRALILAFPHGARAGKAADTAKAFLQEGIGGNLVAGQELVHLASRPICHGIQLDDMAVAQNVEFVDLQYSDFRTACTLLSSHSGDPNIQLGKFFLQRENFAQCAAKVGILLPKFRPVLI